MKYGLRVIELREARLSINSSAVVAYFDARLYFMFKWLPASSALYSFPFLINVPLLFEMAAIRYSISDSVLLLAMQGRLKHKNNMHRVAITRLILLFNRYKKVCIILFSSAVWVVFRALFL